MKKIRLRECKPVKDDKYFYKLGAIAMYLRLNPGDSYTTKAEHILAMIGMEPKDKEEEVEE